MFLLVAINPNCVKREALCLLFYWVQVARSSPTAWGIMAGGSAAPWCSIGGDRYRCGRVPELARQLG